LHTAYLKYITPYKLKNYLRSKITYQRQKGTASNYTVPLPWALSIEPNNSCNLSCVACPVGNNSLIRETGFMDLKLFNDIILQTRKHLIYLNLYFQGESLLHPQIGEMIEIANKNNIYTCLSTNGQLIAKNIDKIVNTGLDKLIISIDGLNEETYQIYRKGGKLKYVTDGIEELIKYKNNNRKKAPYIELQFIVMKHNQNEINKLKKFKKITGADAIRLKSMQIYSLQDKTMITDIDKYSRYKVTNLGIEIKNKLKNHCYRMWSSAVITWDGKVLPCCFDKNANHIMGNTKTTRFNEIWHNKAYNDFRNNISTNRKGISMCNNCTEGLIIKY
jgi:radical SAM protein with 4Fe4S-binding SPASM domain